MIKEEVNIPWFVTGEWRRKSSVPMPRGREYVPGAATLNANGECKESSGW